MKTPTQITNRHIAKLLDRLKVLQLPEIAESEIIKQMHFLKSDLTSDKQVKGEVDGLDKSSHR